MKTKKILAFVLSVVMVISATVVAFAKDSTPSFTIGDKITSTNSVAIKESIQAIKKSAYNSKFAADEKVRVIIELDGSTLIDRAGDDIAAYADSSKGSRYEKSILSAHKALKSKLSERFDISFENSIDYTTVINAFTAVVSYKDLAKIAGFKGVRNAFVAGQFAMPDDDEIIATTAAPTAVDGSAVNGTTYTGKGIVVGVLDSGLDYTHEAFNVSPEDAKYTMSDMQKTLKKAARGLNSGNLGAIVSDKVIFSFDYADGDSDVYPYGVDVEAGDADHGTHVCGIVAGNNGDDFSGIAPDAQLMMFKVFSDFGGGAYTETILSALEDAVRLGVDVINMSLGSPAGFSVDADKAINDVYSRVEKAGIVLCCSAGNEYYQGYGITDYYLPYAANPDYGLVGSPSSYAAALSVASSENDFIIANYALIGDELKVRYYESDTSVSPLSAIYDQEYEYVFCGIGAPEDFAEIDVTGKVALILRGELNFTDKINNAAAAGAVAAVIMDNVDDTLFINMQIENNTIPAVSVLYSTGVKMQNSEIKTICFASEPAELINPDGGLMSDFSSWGCLPDLELKPEITAPGGYIYSAAIGDEYIMMSGTSMASPCMAGSAADLLQYIYASNKKITKADARDSVIVRFMSTASPIYDAYGSLYSPRKQGAGLADIANAVATKSYLTVDGGRPKASAGSSKDGTFKYSFEITNTSNKTDKYFIDTAVMTDYPASDGVDMYSTLEALDLERGVDYTINYKVSGGRLQTYKPFDGEYRVGNALGVRADQNDADASSYITIAGNTTATVNVTIKLTDDAKEVLDACFENGTYVEGFTFVQPMNDVALSIPFLGFYGSWDQLDIFDGTVYAHNAYYFESSMLGLYVDENDDLYGDVLGYNAITGEYDESKIAYSSDYAYNAYGEEYPVYLSSDLGMLRNAKDLKYTIKNAEGKTVAKYNYYMDDARKSYYSIGDDYVTSATDFEFYYGKFDSTVLPEGTYTYTATGSVNGKSQSISFDVTVDKTAPVLDYADIVTIEGEDYLAFACSDNFAAQGTMIYLCALIDGEYQILGSSIDLLSYVALLYELGYIDNATASYIYSVAPLAENAEEDGEVYTYYYFGAFDEFIDAFNAYIAPVLFAEGISLTSDIIGCAAADYAWNMDGIYAVTFD